MVAVVGYVPLEDPSATAELLAGDYELVWRGLSLLLDELSLADRAAVLGVTATECYRIPDQSLAALS